MRTKLQGMDLSPLLVGAAVWTKYYSLKPSVAALHEGSSRLAGDYPAVQEAAFETMGRADPFDFDLQAEAYLDRFRQGFAETGGSLGKRAAC